FHRESLLPSTRGRLPPTATETASSGAAWSGFNPGSRYVDLGPLGEGGMGEVRRARDLVLGRVVAMKLIHPDFAHKADARARFAEEIQIVAQLAHPGIVPVYDTGELDGGRPYFTMPEVRGHHLSVIIGELHRASTTKGWACSVGGWTFRRVMEAFVRACEAMSYAHGRGVIHRDLKPSNIIVDDRGGVTLVDWGLARVVGNDRSGTWPELGQVVLHPRRNRLQTQGTRVVRGTPPYMAPEQALADEQTLQGDVYALGVILYQILAGHAPYEGHGLSVVREQARRPPPPLVEVLTRPVDAALIAICNRAMARERAERYADAGEMVSALLEWREGTLGQERAETLVDQAELCIERAGHLVTEADELRMASQALMASVPSWAPDARKLPGWTLEDRALELDKEALRSEAQAERLLRAALLASPQLARAHAALAERYATLHQEAELRGDLTAQLHNEQLLELHTEALPATHPHRQRFTAYLEGQGALTLTTEPPGAEVHLYRFAERRRRQTPRYLRSLGQTPLIGVSLPMGSYLLVIEREGHLPVRYPVTIGRQGHWNPTPPGSNTPESVRLPPIGSLGPEVVYVPGGWFTAGGDRDQPWSMPERWVWVDGFIIQSMPVTNHRYLAMLNDLVRCGLEEDALKLAPLDQASGQHLMVPNARGVFELEHGTGWSLEQPVRQVSWHCA
ncbi:MAG: protein kinase, partial [Myxococcota bacterium]